MAPTLSAPVATALGALLGTPAYMSPEQAEGRPADARSDVFAFGAVLYEMLTGKRPFDGASELSLLSSILRDTPPPVRRLRPEVDPRIESLVERCLAKDPAARYRPRRRRWCRSSRPASERERAPPCGRLLRRPAWAAGLACCSWPGAFGVWACRRGAAGTVGAPRGAARDPAAHRRGRRVGAFRLAREGAARLAGDPEFERLWKDITGVPTSIRTEPAGAEVFAKPYAEPDGEWERSASPRREAWRSPSSPLASAS